ncbi:MAG TPA: hypothetical protein VMB50_07185, partial [Myxococcales bacterium]|nr:hypothetical protein [Myxococcales bacterium]
MTDTLQSLAGRLGVGTLAVATICATFPPPSALAAPVSRELLAQAYEAPPAYPPTEPPPAYPPTEPPPQGYAPPPPAYAPQFPSSDAQAMADARADVPQEISGTLWFFAGFFLTWVGILLGYLLEPTPDGARLIGKSPAYVTTYTTTYRSE